MNSEAEPDYAEVSRNVYGTVLNTKGDFFMAKQVVVKFDTLDEMKFMLDFFEKNGFSTPSDFFNLDRFEQLVPKVFVIEGKKYYPTNTMCMGARASAGLYPISVEEFINAFPAGKI